LRQRAVDIDKERRKIIGLLNTRIGDAGHARQALEYLFEVSAVLVAIDAMA